MKHARSWAPATGGTGQKKDRAPGKERGHGLLRPYSASDIFRASASTSLFIVRISGMSSPMLK